MIRADGDPAVRDAGLLAAAQRVERYEMAGCRCARTYAKMLGEACAVDLLQKTLNEKRSTAEGLSTLAERLVHATRCSMRIGAAGFS